MLSSFMMPSVLGLLANRAYGQDAAVCSGESAGGDKSTPFLCFDLSGGLSLASNYVVGSISDKISGNPNDIALFSGNQYEVLGRTADELPSNYSDATKVNSAFGLPMFNDSPFLAGRLNAMLSSGKQQNVHEFIAAGASNDDTPNEFNPIHWIAKAGRSGSLVPTIGTNSTVSGGRNLVPSRSQSSIYNPVRIANTTAATNLVTFGLLSDEFSNNQVERILASANRMSDAQMLKFSQAELPEQVSHLVSCGYLRSSQIPSQFSDPGVLDYNQHPILGGLFSNETFDRLNASRPTALNGLNRNQYNNLATIMLLLLTDRAGSATFQLGGFDYHNGTRLTGDSMDYRAGVLMGLAQEAAALLNKPLMIMVFSDGSVSADPNVLDPDVGGFIWRGDSGSKGMYIYSYFSPTVSRSQQKLANFSQIGSFKTNSTGTRTDVDRASSAVANSTVSAAQLCVLSYLALHGEEGRLEEIVGRNSLGGNSEYLAFKKAV